MWSEACLPNYIHELVSDDFNHCIRNANLELRHDVHASADIFLNALYGAAACMVRTVGKKRENAKDWFEKNVLVRRGQFKHFLKDFKDQRKKTLNAVEKICKRKLVS